MSNITKDEVIDWLSGQSVLEIAELVSALEEKWGVSAAAPKAVKEGAAKDEAEELKKKLEATGAKVELK
jgi:large subunit ribosomal protein L7/L12